MVGGVDAISSAKFFRHLKLGRIDVDRKDALRARHFAAINDGETHRAEAKHGTTRVLLDASSVERGTNAGGHPAAEKARNREVSFGVDLGERNVGADYVLTEAGAPHEVEDRAAVGSREARRPVGHHALALRRTDLDAEVRLGRGAEIAEQVVRPNDEGT